MKFWRVHLRAEGGNSDGFVWYDTRRAAKKAMAKVSPETPEDAPTLEAYEIQISKAGVLQALNDLASHPDNG